MSKAKIVLEVNENQLELIHLALCDYQDSVYDEDSPYYTIQDASDFSQLQSLVDCAQPLLES
jgi:hypothetical protein